jgi:ribosomal-protein-alanine N-acetyltransferase
MITLVPISSLKAKDLEGTQIPIELLALQVHKVPWTSYVGKNAQGETVGACCFKSPPADTGAVEIAYITFPQFEGKGCALEMAKGLVEIARLSKEVTSVLAHTLPEENASTTICRKVGFRFVGEMNDEEDGAIWKWSNELT